VILTIHQPNSEITDMFDRLMLMKAGRVMYQGREDDVVDYFAARSHVLPPKYNPADFIMTIAQTVPEEELVILDYFPTEESSGDDDYKEARSLIESTHSKSMVPVKHVSGWVETGWLVMRDMKSIKRNKMILGARMILTTFMSMVIGLIFQDVGRNDSAQPVVRSFKQFFWLQAYYLTSFKFVQQNVQSHFGALIMVTMLAMFSTAMPTLLVFPDERPVFIREYATNHYTVLSYFLRYATPLFTCDCQFPPPIIQINFFLVVESSRLSLEAFLTAIQIMWSVILTYFLVEFQMPFMWLFLIMYALAMSSTASKYNRVFHLINCFVIRILPKQTCLQNGSIKLP
jgi:hypothetical protein